MLAIHTGRRDGPAASTIPKHYPKQEKQADVGYQVIEEWVEKYRYAVYAITRRQRDVRTLLQRFVSEADADKFAWANIARQRGDVDIECE